MLRDLDNNAKDFTRTLGKVVALIEDSASAVHDKIFFDVYSEIVTRSPVKTGAYREANGISAYEPTDTEGQVDAKNKTSMKSVNQVLMEANDKFKFDLSTQSAVWFFNNQDYADLLENGRSITQAPEGIYSVAFKQLNRNLQREYDELIRREAGN